MYQPKRRPSPAAALTCALLLAAAGTAASNPESDPELPSVDSHQDEAMEEIRVVYPPPAERTYVAAGLRPVGVRRQSVS